MGKINPTDYHSISKIQDPRLSPDGESILYVNQKPESDEEYQSHIYQVSSAGGTAERVGVKDGVESEPRWSPDGEKIAFVRTQDTDAELCVTSINDGEAASITRVIGAVSNIAWSPDSSKIAFTQEVSPEEIELGLDIDASETSYEREDPDPRTADKIPYKGNTSYIDNRNSHIYVINIKTEEINRITEGEYDFISPTWGESSSVYYTSNQSSYPGDTIEYDIHKVDIRDNSSEVLTQTTDWDPLAGQVPEVMANEHGHVAFTIKDRSKPSLRKSDLAVYDGETGQVRRLTDELNRSVYRAIRPQWGEDGEQLYFVTPDEGSFKIWKVSPEPDTAPELVYTPDGHLTGFSIREGSITLTQSEWNHPGELFFDKLLDGNITRLTETNSDLQEKFTISEPEELWFESVDGVEIQGWVLTPPNFNPDEMYPLAVEIHGGPHAMWSPSGSMWHEFQVLASQGYVVFWCNPRGSIGYGERYQAAIERGWGDIDYQDIMAGVDEVASRSYVDTNEMFMTGGSYGGYMTAWILGQSNRFKAAVSQRGVYDLWSFYLTTQTKRQVHKYIEWEFAREPWNNVDLLHNRSPSTYVENIDAPLRIIHNENDFGVPISQAEIFFQLLQKNRKKSQLVRYPREGHDLSRSGEPAHVVDRLEQIVDWFNQHSDYHSVSE